MKDLLNVTTDDGKYTVIQGADGRLRALRNGEEWRNLTGDGLILTLAHDLDSARTVAAATKSTLPTSTTQKMVSEVGTERTRQDMLIHRGKIPWNCADPNIPHQLKLPVLAEEFGEVARAMLEQTETDLKTELIQVAAVAVAWAESIQKNLDAGTNAPRVSPRKDWPTPPHKSSLLLAGELGFRLCEKGLNLEAAMSELNKTL
jgi:NTP pyrophosphatase (non-canonical NTP hydrolase)